MTDVVDRLIDALNNHDLDAVMRCYRPDAVATWPDMEACNPQEISSYCTQTWEAFPNLHFTPWEKTACGDAIATEMVVCGTQTGSWLLVGGEVLEATGRSVSARCSCFWNVADDLIASQRFYYDQLQIYAQLGMRLPCVFDPSG
ncbi:nuclear transport factor 2 family protein [Microbispora cellulosiformans]|uniref:Nuclear transport factor 2 family protein n=1 Tax=Microbispora cellulosiformans TaxID=2614688 RepID=A0A5J5K9M6_9ACTN|nr:nuclear transport factor 2 family protein [Microbispora cellulosiformans]KAA9381422.1 nuclear transport factor 2 family protein [Microbispora cellulosiformans]